jgi:tRNA modification GTPase
MGNDTIVALSSGPGRGAIAVLRVSGPRAGDAVRRLSGRDAPPPRRAELRTLRDAAGEVLDRGLVLWFPAPASATGEDVAEVHVHGGRACIEGVLTALTATPGVRLAEPGEFTRRAFVNGRLDLTQAEGIADLVAAETAEQRRQAVRQMQGGLARVYEGWRTRLLRLSAHLEAAIDFAEEEDVPAGLPARVTAEMAALADDMGRHLADGRRGERLREGLHVAIIGPPNAGKSSLFNALVGREAAIVTAQPGTTRDVIEAALDLRGFPVVLADTAGLRQGGDAIEAEGIQRARAWAASADVRVIVIDGAAPAWPVDATALAAEGDIVVLNKADLGGEARPPAAAWAPLAVSARTGAGLDELVERLATGLAARFAVGEAPVMTRQRHREGIAACHAALGEALVAASIEEQAEALRAAATALGRVTGRIGVEDLLDVIFGDFCIGK